MLSTWAEGYRTTRNDCISNVTPGVQGVESPGALCPEPGAPAQAVPCYLHAEQAGLAPGSVPGSDVGRSGGRKAPPDLQSPHRQQLASRQLFRCRPPAGVSRGPVRVGWFPPRSWAGFLHSPFAFVLRWESCLFFFNCLFFLSVGVFKATFWFTFRVAV